MGSIGRKIRTVPSLVPARTQSPSGLKSAWETLTPRPGSVKTSCPLPASQTLAVDSFHAEEEGQVRLCVEQRDGVRCEPEAGGADERLPELDDPERLRPPLGNPSALTALIRHRVSCREVL